MWASINKLFTRLLAPSDTIADAFEGFDFEGFDFEYLGDRHCPENKPVQSNMDQELV